MAGSDDGEIIGTTSKSAASSLVNLAELIREVRREVGYYVHPETGPASLIVHGAQYLAGVVTRKPSLSQYKETLLVEAAVGSVLGPGRATDVSWERTRGRLNHIAYDPAQTRQIKESLETKMRQYIARIQA